MGMPDCQDRPSPGAVLQTQTHGSGVADVSLRTWIHAHWPGPSEIGAGSVAVYSYSTRSPAELGIRLPVAARTTVTANGPACCVVSGSLPGQPKILPKIVIVNASAGAGTPQSADASKSR